MRAYNYMCVGFVLLSMGDTLRYWGSVYYCIHVLALVCLALALALALGGGSPGQRKAASPQATDPTPEKFHEEGAAG